MNITIPSNQINYSLSCEKNLITVSSYQATSIWNFKLEDSYAKISPADLHNSTYKDLHIQSLVVNFLFTQNKNISYVVFEDLQESDLSLLKNYNISGNRLSKIDFFQLPLLWTSSSSFNFTPETWSKNKTGDLVPKRPSKKTGVYYQRFIPLINKTLSLRSIDLDKDLDLFYNWHNKPRVYDLWELNKSKEELLIYLQNQLKDPHSIPLILEFDNTPVGYFEVYWAMEDRIAPYCDANEYDRGFHFLIGEDEYLGLENTGSVLKSISHFIFLDDPRTRRIVVEPRSDNKKVFKYIPLIPGWQFVKEFDFPHKRSALLTCDRNLFFQSADVNL